MPTVQSILANSPRNVPPRNRELLLAYVLGKPREWVLAHPKTRVRTPTATRYRRMLRRLSRGEPLPYLLGEQWFYGRPFTVNRDVLIPRPETECMIELALDWITDHGVRISGPEIPDPKSIILDLGTGSGCIAVTLAKELPDARVIGIDASPTALRVARTNARRHGVAERVTFLRGNLLEPLLKPSLRARADSSRAERGNPVVRARWSGLRSRARAEARDLARSAPRNDTHVVVLANLPYLTTAEWRALPRSLRVYEPRMALDGGPDGLSAFRALLAQLRNAFQISNRKFQILLEIDPRRKRTLAALIRKTLPGWEASWHLDLSGRYRVLRIQH